MSLGCEDRTPKMYETIKKSRLLLSWKVLIAATSLQLLGSIGLFVYITSLDDPGFAGLAGFLLIVVSLAAFLVSLPVAYLLAKGILKTLMSWLLVLVGVGMFLRSLLQPIMLPIFSLLILGPVASGVLGILEDRVGNEREDSE